MKQYILGIDIGTTGTKTLLFSSDGELLGRAYREYSLTTPKVGWSEQSAEDWWQAVVETVREVCCQEDIAQNVVAISLSTQGGTVVPVDNDGHSLRPAIVWNDQRSAALKETFMEEVGGDDVMYATTGWHLGNGLPALAIRWLRENEPDVFKQTKFFLTVPDYISMKLTGIPAIDLSNAGINQLSNIRCGIYDEKLLNFSGVHEKQLAKIVHSGEKIGQLTKMAAHELGLNTKTVLVSGAHDQYAVAIGAGATNAGDILIGSGTCWVVTAMNESPDFDSCLSQSVAAVPGLWGSLQSLSSGGVCLDWLRKYVGKEQEMSYDVINREVIHRKAAEDGLFFYPFTGKAGGKQKLKRASFIGLDLSHDRFHLALAVMEGVVFQILWMMETFKAKPSKEGIILSGGASKSPVWAQLVADISGLPVRIPEVADLACVGAAVMAGVGCGLYENVENGYRQLAVKEHILQPNLAKTKVLAPLFAEYKRKAELLI
ncbi:MAG: hypothetical protein GX800_10085 [Clostridiaceae bacterium]|nr:hypothetical protein [Clostridiaceae bacterium]